jgi:hypothetical protein
LVVVPHWFGFRYIGRRGTTGCSGQHSAPPLNRSVTLLEDHRQELLLPTTIGGGATTVELADQVAPGFSPAQPQNADLKVGATAN